MNPELIVFLLLSLITVASALAMLFSRNAVYSAVFLVLNFTAVAVFYLMLGAPFIAMSQITVYAGAIMVLFLFVIMLLGAENLPPSNTLPWQRPLAAGLALALAAEILYLLFTRARTSLNVAQPDAFLNTMESLREMALTLFNQYLLPFEITSVLLLVAMVGVIVLARQEKAG